MTRKCDNCGVVDESDDQQFIDAAHEANKLDKLETWATMAAEELQEFIDEAQEAAGDPDGTDALPSVRALLLDLDKILMPGLFDD